MNKIAYIKYKEYIYVLTNNDDNINQLDISIFETDEWNNLIKISKVFEEAVLLDKSDYINISQIYKNSVYYLYYSPFCNLIHDFCEIVY